MRLMKSLSRGQLWAPEITLNRTILWDPRITLRGQLYAIRLTICVNHKLLESILR